MTDTAFLPDTAIAAAQQLAGIVHGDGGQPEVTELLQPMTRRDLYALAVALAAMVDVDRTPLELLGWNDHPAGQTCPVCGRTPTYRGGNTCTGEQSLCAANRRAYYHHRYLARAHRAPDPLDRVKAERIERGERVGLTGDERRAAVALLHGRGLTPAVIADRLRMSGSRVRQLLPTEEAS